MGRRDMLVVATMVPLR